MGSVPIHWAVQEGRDVPDGDSWLTPREREVEERLKVQKRRNDWRLGRWTAKLAVGAYLRSLSMLRPAGIEILARDDGSPEARLGGAPAPVELSLSHSDDAAFCVVGDRGVRIGCDIELIARRSDLFAEDYFTAAEVAMVRRASPHAHTGLETLVWSAKESALKALRDGLRRDTRSVVVELDSSVAEWEFAAAPCRSGMRWAPLAVLCDDGRRFDGWWATCEGRVLSLVSAPGAELPHSLDLTGSCHAFERSCG